MSSASVFGSFYREVVSSKNKAATITNLRIKQNSYSTCAFCRRAKASSQTLSWRGGQRYLLLLYTAELKRNVGTFLAFLWTSNRYEWYVSEGPGVEFAVRLTSMWRTCSTAWYAHVHPSSHECDFPGHVERILPLKIISVDLTFAK